jgi:1-acyl-sn-glycerol-3-phosphate acyltransferase
MVACIMIATGLAVVRALLFYLGYIVVTVMWGTLSVLVGWAFPYRLRFVFVIGCWTRMVLVWLRWCCGIRVKIDGLENIPSEACIVFVKHESTWETLFIQTLFAPQATIVKKELLHIPFFGWAFRLLRPIAIDRSDPRSALRALIREGTARLDQNIWVVLFPEGTRVPPGESRDFQIGGAALAESSARSVLVVAHNAGDCWPAHTLAKRPGTITVRICPPISTIDKRRKEINALAANAMQSAMLEVGRRQMSRFATDSALETIKSRLGST